MKPYDVVVVGAGPAGSICAYHLAKAGVHVVVLDALHFPREKACGGGVQRRAVQNIPFDFSSVVRGTLSGVSFTLNFGQNCLRTYPDDLVYSILRSEFDLYLLQQAAIAGADVRHGVKALRVAAEKESATVDTTSGCLKSRYVVGADGANSVVAKVLNRRETYFWQAALYCEVGAEHLEPTFISKRNMRVDWGTLPSGYAWIFPKLGSANIGVGGPAALGRMLRPYLLNFLATERILTPDALPKLRFRGHQLPTLTDRTLVENSSVLLVGDAAGLVEPFTGDGISQACHSGQLAAEAIVEGLGFQRRKNLTYTQRIRRDIGTELLWSRKLMSWAVTFPNTVYRAFKINDRVWNTFCRVLRAEASFKNLRNAALGPLQALCLPIDFVVERCEQRKIDRFYSNFVRKLAVEVPKTA